MADLFGHWPSFHDAELLAVRLDAQAPGGATLEADVEMSEPSDEVDARGYTKSRQRCRATFRFHNVNRLSLDEFRKQNVLDDLEVRRLELPDPEEHRMPWGPRRLAVEFVPIPGFCALAFCCDRAEVAHAESTLPAP